jgi:hypothetical protein
MLSARRYSLKSGGLTPLAFGCCRAQLQAMSILFDPTDFSVVVKKRAPPWRCRYIGLVERAR